MVGSGSLIPQDRSYKRQMKLYEGEVRRAGMARMHGLRHGYAIRRYKHLTEWKARAVGGPARVDLAGEDRKTDHKARLNISCELGYVRISVVACYLWGGVSRPERMPALRAG